MNISGCQLLTDLFLLSVMAIGKYHRVSLSMMKTKFSAEVFKEWESFTEKNRKCEENVIK
jgi:hypothetical protein